MLRRVPANMLSSTRKPLGAAGDVVEYHARPILVAQDRLGGEPDILLPAGAVDVADLAERLGSRKPFAQIVVGDCGFDIAVLLHRFLLETAGWRLQQTCQCSRPGFAWRGGI